MLLMLDSELHEGGVLLSHFTVHTSPTLSVLPDTLL